MLLFLLAAATRPVANDLMAVTGRRARDEPVGYISTSTAVEVFLIAHQDDWQLFMGDIVAARIRGGNRTIFIYLTAGDDGRDSLYWLTREQGALQSTRLAAQVTAPDRAATNCSAIQLRGHSIRRCSIANTESYFLRLPDGKRDGGGFARHSYQSLRKLRTKRISSITAIDGSATYSGWADLFDTMKALIGADSADSGTTLHTNDPNIIVNPHDHFDHRMAGLLVADLRKKTRWNAMYYVGYALATRADNRSTKQAREKTALFLAYDREMQLVNKAWSAYEEHPVFYSECMLRTYARRAHPR